MSYDHHAPGGVQNMDGRRSVARGDLHCRVHPVKRPLPIRSSYGRTKRCTSLFNRCYIKTHYGLIIQMDQFRPADSSVSKTRGQTSHLRRHYNAHFHFNCMFTIRKRTGLQFCLVLDPPPSPPPPPPLCISLCYFDVVAPPISSGVVIPSLSISLAT